jgi:hypothetical protein
MTIPQERMTVAGLVATAVLSVAMIVFGNASLAADADRGHGAPARDDVGVVSRADRR